MATIYFPERLDLEPGHQVTDELGQVFGAAPPSEWALRSGLLFADPLQNMYCFHVVRSHNFRGVGELVKRWTGYRVGAVPWQIRKHDGYEAPKFSAENYIRCATPEAAQIELNAAVALICSSPVVAVYYTQNVNAQNPVYARIPGLFAYAAESLSDEWPIGHATGLVLVKMNFEQVADNTLSVDAEGIVTEHVMQ